MGALNLTIEVKNIAPAVTVEEVQLFFSYCGTVDKVQLLRDDKDESRSALVTFRQPFAFQTALLLDNAIISGRPIRIWPLKDSSDNLSSIAMGNDTKGNQNQEQVGHVQIKHGVDNIATPLGKYKLSEKSGKLFNKTWFAIRAAKKSMGNFGTVLMKYPHVVAGLIFLSGVLYKAARYASEVRDRKRD